MNLQSIIESAEIEWKAGYGREPDEKEKIFIKTIITSTYLSTLTLVEEGLSEEKEAAKRLNTFKEGYKAGWNSYRTEAKANITKMRENIK